MDGLAGGVGAAEAVSGGTPRNGNGQAPRVGETRGKRGGNCPAASPARVGVPGLAAVAPGSAVGGVGGRRGVAGCRAGVWRGVWRISGGGGEKLSTGSWGARRNIHRVCRGAVEDGGSRSGGVFQAGGICSLCRKCGASQPGLARLEVVIKGIARSCTVCSGVDDPRSACCFIDSVRFSWSPRTQSAQPACG